MAAALGIPTYGIRVCAQCRDNGEELCKTVQELMIISLVTALGTVLLPRASYYVETKQTRQYIHVLEKAFQFVIASALPLTLFFMLEAKDTLGFLAGEEFTDISGICF